jgi:polysaccharide export outer membrane protein
MERSLRWHRRTPSAGGAWLIGGLLLLAGCNSVPGERYSVDTLPSTLIAARRENAQTVDLSRLASAAVNSELIDRGDVVEVTIATGLSEKESFPRPVRVREDGVADIPVIGPVHLAGLQLAEAEAAIYAAAVQGQTYRSPYITVTMKHQRVNKVTVVGAVKEPGVYEIPRGQSDLLAALVEAGGLADNAGTMVEIRNPTRDVRPPDPIASANPDGVGPVGYSAPGTAPTGLAVPRQSVRVDLVSAAKNGTGGYLVDDGAVVMVERRDPEPVHVIGLVHKPDRYEFPIGEDLRVTHAVALAGGLSSPVANKIFVIRKKPDSTQTAIVTLKLSDAKRSDKHDLLLAPGDVVSVEQTPLTVFIDTMRIINFGFGASLPLTAL